MSPSTPWTASTSPSRCWPPIRPFPRTASPPPSPCAKGSNSTPAHRLPPRTWSTPTPWRGTVATMTGAFATSPPWPPRAPTHSSSRPTPAMNPWRSFWTFPSCALAAARRRCPTAQAPTATRTATCSQLLRSGGAGNRPWATSVWSSLPAPRPRTSATSLNTAP